MKTLIGVINYYLNAFGYTKLIFIHAMIEPKDHARMAQTLFDGRIVAKLVFRKRS